MKDTKIVFIIGNGFDLHHDINSSYANFCHWLQENDWDTLEQIEEIYGEVYNVLDRFPGIKLALPHGFFMGHCLPELAKVLDKYPNVSIDLAPGPALFQASVGRYDEFKAFFENSSNTLVKKNGIKKKYWQSFNLLY